MVYRSTEHNKHRLIKNMVFYVYTLMFEISIIHSYTRTVDEPSILILIYRFNKKKVISKWKGRATILPFSQNIINMHYVHEGVFFPSESTHHLQFIVTIHVIILMQM